MQASNDSIRSSTKRTTCTACGPTWFAEDDGGSPFPACVCPVVAGFASQLYWTLPASRRAQFAGIEVALCGTRTDDEDELLRRMWAVFSAAVRVNGTPTWTQRIWRDDVLAEAQSKRGRGGCEEWAVRTADSLSTQVTAGGPVSAWLAMDDLSDLLVSVEVKR